MSFVPSQRIVLVRHGETAWSKLGKHTGRTDVPITEHGRAQALALAPLLAQHRFALVMTSPLSRAKETCALAGFAEQAIDEPDLMEWDYGATEGRTTLEIRETQPAWSIWNEGPQGGERIEDVAVRADRVIDRAMAAPGDVLCFAHGHLLRILAARWIEWEATVGRRLVLDPATMSVLGFERKTRAILSWNRAGDLAPLAGLPRPPEEPPRVGDDVLGPRGDELEEAMEVVGVQRPRRLLEARQISGEGPEELPHRVARRALRGGVALPSARLVDEPAERCGDALRLRLEPLPVARQQRHLAGHDAQLRPTGLRLRSDAVEHVLDRSREVEVDLASGRVLEDEHTLDTVVDGELRAREHVGQATVREETVTGERCIRVNHAGAYDG